MWMSYAELQTLLTAGTKCDKRQELENFCAISKLLRHHKQNPSVARGVAILFYDRRQ